MMRFELDQIKEFLRIWEPASHPGDPEPVAVEMVRWLVDSLEAVTKDNERMRVALAKACVDEVWMRKENERLEKERNEWKASEMSHVPPSQKLWRTLVRVVSVNHKCGCFHVVVPGWDARNIIELNLDSVPDKIRPLLKPDERLYARVNTGADHAGDLRFEGWEDA